MLGQEAQQKEIEKILLTFNNDMARIILEVEKLISRWMFENKVTPTTSLAFDKMVTEALTKSGYYAAVNKMVGEDFNSIYPMIQEGLAMGGLFSTYTSDDLLKITALQAIEANKFSVLASSSATALRDNLYKYTLSDYSIEDMAKQITKDLEGTDLVKYSKTLARTVAGEMQQTTLDMEAADLDGVYLYIGPLDGVTRDFCECVIKKNHYYDKKQKQQIQTAPERRYNCRHRLRMVSEDYALSQGYSKADKADCV